MGRVKNAPTKKVNRTACSLDEVIAKYGSVSTKSKKREPKMRAPGTKVLLATNESEEKYFGQVWIGETNNSFPEVYEECRAEIFPKQDNDVLVVYTDGATVIIKITTDVQFLKDLLSTKIFSIKFGVIEGQVSASLYMVELPLPKFNQRVANVLKVFFHLVYQVGSEELDCRRKSTNLSGSQEISEFYQKIKEIRESEVTLPELEVSHPALNPNLRPYQKEAVKWMIMRETKGENEQEILHPMFEEVKLESGKLVYFNKYIGYLQEEKPLIQPLRTGGILADEMGLGKTVEVLALILLNPKLELEDSIDHDTTFSEDESPQTSESLSTPVVEKQQPKKRKLVEKEPEYVDVPKKLKVPKNWVKGKNKTPNRVALEMWYESTLSNYACKSTSNTPRSRVQCICGSDSEDNGVTCVECEKIQHYNCMGYRKEYGPYLCPQCWKNQPLLESKATLIVCPISLEKQWCSEICKHVKGNFKVLEYNGSKSVPVYPTKLCSYDLVITTYTVLQNELKLSESSDYHSSMLRRAPKYAVPGSPILFVKWWRLCLDEAQAVESPEMMVSTMAKKLTAHHRWAVTGTPISRNVSDIYGLINYLQFSPYDEEDTWNHLFYRNYTKGNYEPLCKLLSKLLWRTAKTDVIQQIDIPEQTMEVTSLDFTAVERFFYDREHECSRKDFLSKLSKYDPNTPLKSLDKSSMKAILAPLLSLRQACAHHNAVKGRYLVTRRPVRSMEDLLYVLIEKNVTDSEDYARIIVAALNGLAGVALLKNDPNGAIQRYREVIKFCRDFEAKGDELHEFEIDSLQLIHTFYNLNDVLKDQQEAKTSEEDDLLEKCQKLELKYGDRFHKGAIDSLHQITKSAASVDTILSKFQLKLGQWYFNALDWIGTKDLMEDFNTKIQNTLTTQNITSDKNIRFFNKNDFIKMVGIWDEDVTQLRLDTINSVEKLYTLSDSEKRIFVTNEIINAARDCHLRPSKKKKSKKEKCPICLSSDQFKQYECKLFSMKVANSTVKEDHVVVRGNWKASVEEFVLKGLQSFCVSKNVDDAIIKDGKNHLKLLDVMKTEFKELRMFWTQVESVVSSQDEINMSKIRLQLKEDFEVEENDLPKELQDKEKCIYDNIHMLSQAELDYQQLELQNEVMQTTRKLEKCFGTHSYLSTLRTRKVPPDPCPICKNQLEKQYNVLICGHALCLECMQVLVGQSISQYINCPVCREKHGVDDISFVQPDAASGPLETEEIKGNCSSKVAKIVSHVIKLKEQDPDVKVLVFSSFQILLKILKSIFDLNDISSEILSSNSIQKVLDKFKDPSRGVTVLLLPLHLGSKGLNLIEATHVIFVEPVLNPADELQAIGRVHRIGQTRKTYVYKFLMRNTIEESIQQATTTNAQKWDSNKVTLKELRTLFEGQ